MNKPCAAHSVYQHNRKLLTGRDGAAVAPMTRIGAFSSASSAQSAATRLQKINDPGPAFVILRMFQHIHAITRPRERRN